MSDPSPPDLSLPSGWPRNVKSAVLHVISLAQYAIVATRGWAADALNPRARQAAEDDRLKQEIQLLREELRIKDARVTKIDPRRRPYYPAGLHVPSGPCQAALSADTILAHDLETMDLLHGGQAAERSFHGTRPDRFVGRRSNG